MCIPYSTSVSSQAGTLAGPGQGKVQLSTPSICLVPRGCRMASVSREYSGPSTQSTTACALYLWCLWLLRMASRCLSVPQRIYCCILSVGAHPAQISTLQQALQFTPLGHCSGGEKPGCSPARQSSFPTSLGY